MLVKNKADLAKKVQEKIQFHMKKISYFGKNNLKNYNFVIFT